jgi:small subunit ribosomal protein S4
MSRYTGPKCRLCRREGIKLYLKGERCESQKCAIVRKNYIPGMHGPKGSFAKKSEYARQLREKQKAKRVYFIGERQFEAYYEKALKTTEITSEALLKLLETRLDNVIYRSGLASSRSQARQMVNHGLVKLNNKKVSIPSVQVKIGDKFEIVDSNKNSTLFANTTKKKDSSPKWLKVDLKSLNGEVIRRPEKSELESSIAGHLIVEYYSK